MILLLSSGFWPPATGKTYELIKVISTLYPLSLFWDMKGAEGCNTLIQIFFPAQNIGDSLQWLFTIYFKRCDSRHWSTWLVYWRLVIGVFPLSAASLYHLKLLMGHVRQAIDPTHVLMIFRLANVCVRLKRWWPLTKGQWCPDSEFMSNLRND